jgi:hypothetical protein
VSVGAAVWLPDASIHGQSNPRRPWRYCCGTTFKLYSSHITQASTVIYSFTITQYSIFVARLIYGAVDSSLSVAFIVLPSACMSVGITY